MEPEEHIYFYGIDHYLETLFPKDSKDYRKMRRKNLLSYSCLQVMQHHYESSHKIYRRR
jgi:hypothetical protein